MNITLLEHRSAPGQHKELNSGLGVEDAGLSWPFAAIHALFVKLPVVSPGYLAGFLESLGHCVRFESKLSSTNTDLVLFGFTLVDFENELKFFESVYRHSSDRISFVVYGNILRDPKYLELLKLLEKDSVVSGDLAELMEFFKKSEANPYESLKVKINPKEIGRTRYFPMLSLKHTHTIQASWGCPYPCRYYCPYGAYQGNVLRLRSPEVVVEEMTILKRDYGISNFVFRDPVFGLDKRWLKSFLELLISQKQKYRMAIETRPDIWSDDELKELYRAGVRSINFGFDTVTASSLSKTKRSMKYDRATQSIKTASRLGIFVNVFFVVGFPWETFEEIREGIRKFSKLPMNFLRISVATPFSGTDFDLEYGHLYKSRTASFLSEVKESDNRPLQKEIRNTMIRFYLHPRRIFRNLMRVIA